MSRRAELARLFAAETPRLSRFLRRFGSSVSAEDIAQDSFERFCSADPEHVVSPRAYLFRTARNLALNAAARKARSPVTFLDAHALEARSEEPNPEERVLEGEKSEQLHAALGVLPEHKRRALLLFKCEGYSYRDVGERLGVSPRTVERYVADALAHCQRELRGLRED